MSASRPTATKTSPPAKTSRRGRPVSPEAAARIVELHQEDLSYLQIAERMTAEDWPTAHGGSWSSSSIAQVLERVGVLVVPPFLPPEQLEEIERLIKEERYTLAKVAKEFNERGVPTPRERNWNAASISQQRQRARVLAVVA